MLEGTSLPYSPTSALLGSALFCCLGFSLPPLIAQGREQSSPDLCSHHPPCWMFYADRGNDFNVPVNKLSGRISLKGQTSELASPPRRCPGKEKRFQLCAHTHTTCVPPVPAIFQPFKKTTSQTPLLKKGKLVSPRQGGHRGDATGSALPLGRQSRQPRGQEPV